MSDTPPETHPSDLEDPGFKWLSGWSRLFVEMLVITFGVLLAFGLNAWWEGRKQAEFDRVSLSQVYDEIDRNYDTIANIYSYRTDLYPKILSVENGNMLMSETGFQGTRPPQIEKAAYDLALASGVFARSKPESAQTLISIYLDFDGIKNTHQLYASSLPQLIVEMEDANDPRIATFMRMAFMDMIFAEGETLNEIAEISDKPTVMEPWQFISQASRQSASQTSKSE